VIGPGHSTGASAVTCAVCAALVGRVNRAAIVRVGADVYGAAKA
jgi:hypothetical protein